MSAQKVCEEILVVDSQSTDRTCEIAKELGASVIIQPYLGDGRQKAFGAPLAKYDWILSLDADERLDDDAVDAVQDIDLETTAYEAFSFARKTYVGSSYIKLWYPDRVVRLYNRSKCGFSKDGGHARVESDLVKDLDAHLLHYSYDNYAQMIKTSHKFITRGAVLAHKSGKRAAFYDPFMHGVGALFKALVLKRGIFHGVDGFNVAVVSSFSSYMKYALMLEMQKNE